MRKRRQPETFLLTLPSGQVVSCWQSQREGIRAEVARFGSIMLVNDPDPDVYRHVPRGSVEYDARQAGARPG